MAQAPRVKKQSPKQQAAEHANALKWAAAGRASQKAAASNPKTAAATHAKRSAAARRGAATAARNRSLRKAGKKVPTSAQKRAAIAPTDADFLPADALPGYTWLMGCNDTAPTCAAAAVANHLLISTGLRMTDENILQLHNMAGGDDGADIASVLECVKVHRSCFGEAAKAYLYSYTPTDIDCIVSGLVVGVKLPHAGHAVVSTSSGMISWGRVMPFEGTPQEAWALEWLR